MHTDIYLTGKLYHKLSDEVDQCRSRFASTPKNKHADRLDAKNLLIATSGVFLHASLEYAYKINIILSREYTVIVERILAYMFAVNMFYVQGSDVMKDIDGLMKQTSVDMSKAASDLKAHKRRMEVQ